MQKITTAWTRPLHNIAATRQVEQQAAATLPPHTLMQRAGLAVARLTLALAPHAQRIWIACGPGNNGGDGFEAARLLHEQGKDVIVTWTGLPDGKAALPPDAQASREAALRSCVPMSTEPPAHFDFCIDALLGIGGKLDPDREGTALMQRWLELMHRSGSPRLAVDIPTGLNADTGCSPDVNDLFDAANSSRTASLFTLSLLTLKPGLLTANGRDQCGEIWLDDLGIGASALVPPSAWLLGADHAFLHGRMQAPHASHKGSFGDVAVLGGEAGDAAQMTGAALLAARAALHSGAGRVFVALLGNAAITVDTQQPELMFRSPDALDLKRQIIVCGCGGGEAVKTILAKVLSLSRHLVLDADALNAVASDTQFQTLLRARSGRDYGTVLTPHPLEAARLLQSTAAHVQADRLAAAHQLAEKFQCVVVLKGSGTVIAAPGRQSFINSSGNALLATPGSGDVLAGMIGARIAAGIPEFDAACSAVFTHGQFADDWAIEQPGRLLSASALAHMSGANPAPSARSGSPPAISARTSPDHRQVE